jgi:hypothetical protein
VKVILLFIHEEEGGASVYRVPASRVPSSLIKHHKEWPDQSDDPKFKGVDKFMTWLAEHPELKYEGHRLHLKSSGFSSVLSISGWC